MVSDHPFGAVLMLWVLFTAGCAGAVDREGVSSAVGDGAPGDVEAADPGPRDPPATPPGLAAGDWWRYEVSAPNGTWSVTAVLRDDLGHPMWTLDRRGTARELAAHRVPWVGHTFDNGTWIGAFYDDAGHNELATRDLRFHWLGEAEPDTRSLQDHHGSATQGDGQTTIRYTSWVNMTTVYHDSGWFSEMHFHELDWSLRLVAHGSGWNATSWAVTQRNEFRHVLGGVQSIDFLRNGADAMRVHYSLDCPLAGAVTSRLAPPPMRAESAPYYSRTDTCPTQVDEQADTPGPFADSITHQSVPTAPDTFTGDVRVLMFAEIPV